MNVAPDWTVKISLLDDDVIIDIPEVQKISISYQAHHKTGSGYITLILTGEDLLTKYGPRIKALTITRRSDNGEYVMVLSDITFSCSHQDISVDDMVTEIKYYFSAKYCAPWYKL